jgi:hypothetical protein
LDITENKAVGKISRFFLINCIIYKTLGGYL